MYFLQCVYAYFDVSVCIWIVTLRMHCIVCYIHIGMAWHGMAWHCATFPHMHAYLNILNTSFRKSMKKIKLQKINSKISRLRSNGHGNNKSSHQNVNWEKHASHLWHWLLNVLSYVNTNAQAPQPILDERQEEPCELRLKVATVATCQGNLSSGTWLWFSCCGGRYYYYYYYFYYYYFYFYFYFYFHF